MIKLGMKLFSGNALEFPEFSRDTLEFINSREDMFLELMVVPGSYEDTSGFFKNMVRTPLVVIHNAHEAYGFNAADSSKREENKKMLNESSRFADLFASPIIVVHAGNDFGKAGLEETILQFSGFNDSRVAVENLPIFCDDKITKMHGLTAAEIRMIQEASGCKFCFDFSHAVCSACGLGVPVDGMLAEFAALRPDLYHLCDGDVRTTEDDHLHYGEGNFDLDGYLRKYVADDGLVTMETGQDKPVTIEPWVRDYDYLRRLSRR